MSFDKLNGVFRTSLEFIYFYQNDKCMT